jgi:hypothetical protein
MSTNSINQLSNSYLESILENVIKNSEASGTNNNTTTANSNATSSTDATDNSQLSPFAQILSTLQQLQQSNPTEYAQLTQQIATGLQTAAQTAQSQGNTSAAKELSQLATDFTNASTSGQLPNIQDLAQALGGHHHHGDGDSDSTSSGQQLHQLLASLETNSQTNQSLNPQSIILQTLSNAGINIPNG